jgi:hypothetical protein
MELRSHSSLSCHLVAIHVTPTQGERNVTQIYYKYSHLYYIVIIDVKFINTFSSWFV